MKRLLSILLLVSSIFIIPSCETSIQQDNESESYLLGYDEGFNEGEDYLFSILLNASASQEKVLVYGSVWETKDFSLTFTDYKDTSGHYLDCQLTLYDLTIDEADENDNVYIGIYSSLGNQKWNRIVPDYNFYYMNAVLDENYTFGNNTSKATFTIKDNQRYVVAIIVVNGSIYNASYLLNDI